jgi:hypothetical protein
MTLAAPDKAKTDAMLHVAVNAARMAINAAARFCDARYQSAEFHRRIFLELAQLRTQRRKILIVMPPKHGKTKLLVETLAWLIGHNPRTEISLVSATDSDGIKTSREIRDRISLNPRYHLLFQTSLSSKEQGVWNWKTTEGGGIHSVGISRQVKGGQLLVVDDPFEDYRQAQSAAERARVWEWFKGTCYTKLAPDASIIVACSRMHYDDLAGRIIRSGESDWVVLQYSAIKNEK